MAQDVQDAAEKKLAEGNADDATDSDGEVAVCQESKPERSQGWTLEP